MINATSPGSYAIGPDDRRALVDVLGIGIPPIDGPRLRSGRLLLLAEWRGRGRPRHHVAGAIPSRSTASAWRASRRTSH